MHEGPQRAPQDPLPAPSGVTVRVEERYGGAPVPLPAGLAAALQPDADPEQEQQEQEGEQQAQVDAGNHQRPQQPAGGDTRSDVSRLAASGYS